MLGRRGGLAERPAGGGALSCARPGGFDWPSKYFYKIFTEKKEKTVENSLGAPESPRPRGGTEPRPTPGAVLRELNISEKYL